ncbi:MAG: hypothetical protein H6825_11305 [Planctomycetes bacterium]|nr:hypothetical protein [Planctomycetota bacterium]
MSVARRPHLPSDDAARARLDELLLRECTEGLDGGERAELESLLQRFPEVDRDAWALLAAAVDLALSPPPGPLPDDVRARLQARLRID